MTTPTADDLALAREIVAHDWTRETRGAVQGIASLIAKHRQPPPTMTLEEQMAEIDEKFATTPGVQFHPLKVLPGVTAKKGPTLMSSEPQPAPAKPSVVSVRERAQAAQRQIQESLRAAIAIHTGKPYIVWGGDLVASIIEDHFHPLVPAAGVEELRRAAREALAAIDEAYAVTGHVKVSKTSEQRLRIEAALAQLEPAPNQENAG